MSRLRAVLLAALVGGLAAGCASTGGTPRPFPTPGADRAAGEPSPPGPAAPGLESRGPAPLDGFVIAGAALRFRGTPYQYGGSDPDSGFDCSGLVQYVYGQYGIHVPRDVASQYHAGTRIARNEVRPGDLFFFETEGQGRGASHVAIAISAQQFVHAPSSDGVVRVEALDSSYWAPRYLGARRLLSD